jgi:hypothetical protein
MHSIESVKMNALLAKEMVAAIPALKDLISYGHRFTIGMDCWSKKGLTASFLGISACFFNRSAKVSQHVFLNLFRIAHPHTGKMIADKLRSSLAR